MIDYKAITELLEELQTLPIDNLELGLEWCDRLAFAMGLGEHWDKVKTQKTAPLE